jgi:hypothetical protein
MKIRDLLASAVCLAMALADRAAEIPVAPPSASSRIAQIKQRGSLRVAVLDEYPWLKQNTNAGDKPFAGPALLLGIIDVARYLAPLRTLHSCDQWCCDFGCHGFTAT